MVGDGRAGRGAWPAFGEALGGRRRLQALRRHGCRDGASGLSVELATAFAGDDVSATADWAFVGRDAGETGVEASGIALAGHGRAVLRTCRPSGLWHGRHRNPEGAACGGDGNVGAARTTTGPTGRPRCRRWGFPASLPARKTRSSTAATSRPLPSSTPILRGGSGRSREGDGGPGAVHGELLPGRSRVPGCRRRVRQRGPSRSGRPGRHR